MKIMLIEFVQTTLDEVCHLITDGKHGDCENQENSGYYFLSAKDVKDGKLNYDSARQISENDFLDARRRTRLEPLDILITNSGSIGRMAIASISNLTARTTFQKSVAILKPDQNKILPLWLYYCLHSDIERLISYAGGTAQKNLLLRDLRAFTINVPSIPIQSRIVEILSAYDDLIENNTQRIQALEQAAHDLYREWFVEFRYPGHESVPLVDSGTDYGMIPQGWEVVKLEKIADVNALSIHNGTTPTEIEYIDISSVSTGVIETTQIMSFENAPSRARRIVRHGDTIWATVRPNRRSYALILRPSENLIVSTGFAVITPLKVPYSYLYKSITTDAFAEYLTNHATGSAYPAVNTNDFKLANILLPSTDIDEMFHNIVANFYEEKAILEQKNIVLREARDLLLPRLISGELDVSEIDFKGDDQ